MAHTVLELLSIHFILVLINDAKNCERIALCANCIAIRDLHSPAFEPANALFTKIR